VDEELLQLSSPPERICIVMMSAIGDAVHVLPVVNALRRAYPRSHISWVIQPVPHVLVREQPAVDDFIVFRRRKGSSGWMSFAEIRQALRGRRFDLLLALQVYFKAGLITWLASADVKLGFDRARARDLNWLFTTHRIRPHPPQHVQDQYFEFLHAIGVRPEPVEWNLQLTPEEREAQRGFFGDLDRPVCALVVGTSRPQKNWHPEGYARIAEELHRKHGFQTVLLGGPSPLERHLADRILAEARVRPIDALGDDLRRLVYILEGSALVVSPDTGPLHISRAVEVPVVGLYGYTNPKRHSPYRKYTDLMVDGYARFPGEDYPLSMQYRDGMGRITVENVLEKIELAITRYVRA
jgi:heptosyltransferase I